MYAACGDIDAESAGHGAWQGAEIGGAASSVLIVTPLAPIAAVAPVIGALVGAVVGGLTTAVGGMSEEEKSAITTPIYGLVASVQASDNPYALDAMAEAAERILATLGGFASDYSGAVSPSDERAIGAWSSTLNEVKAAARQKAGDLRAAGKAGTPLPAGSKQAEAEAEADAVAKAALSAKARKAAHGRARWTAVFVGFGLFAGGSWWWLSRHKKTPR